MRFLSLGKAIFSYAMELGDFFKCGLVEWLADLPRLVAKVPQAVLAHVLHPSQPLFSIVTEDPGYGHSESTQGFGRGEELRIVGPSIGVGHDDDLRLAGRQSLEPKVTPVRTSAIDGNERNFSIADRRKTCSSRF